MRERGGGEEKQEERQQARHGAMITPARGARQESVTPAGASASLPA
ncbi:hypothetical protein [Falsiroseomonas sp. HW251]